MAKKNEIAKAESVSLQPLESIENLIDEFTRSKAVFDLAHIQTLNWHERLFLGLLVKSLI